MTDVGQSLESRRSRIGRWAGAAAIVCALHVGGATLALMYWQDAEDADDPGGALTLEMAALPAAVPVDSEPVAHGAEQDAGETTSRVSRQVVEKAQEDIRLVERAPVPEPAVVLPKPQLDEKEQPQEEAKEAVPKKEKPPAQERAELTTRPPPVEAQPAPGSAPSQELSASLARAQQRWMSGMTARINRFKRYPEAASRRGIRGVVMVRFTVDRSGQVVASEVLESSGSPILDEEALALVKRASPFPVPPDAIPDALLENDLPIWFGMKPNR